MVLNRNADNFFAETEQVAYCPANIVPGIEFTNDPLLQARLFSYLDTQLSRLGGPNFHQIPINAPRCPFQNNQRDGIRQMQVPKGRVAYEPNSLGDTVPRENPTLGFHSYPEEMTGEKTRRRTQTFADHYSQARLFYRSMTEPEQRHIVSALAFELGKVETVAIRKRMLGHLQNIDPALLKNVESALGMPGQADKIKPAVAPRDLKPSPSLSLIRKTAPTLAGRKIGVLIADGFDGDVLTALRAAAKKEKASLAVIAQKIGGATNSAGKLEPVEHALSGASSIFFDAVVILAGENSAGKLAKESAAISWVFDAFSHLKVLGYADSASALISRTGIDEDEGVLKINDKGAVASFIKAAKNGRLWKREPSLRSPG
jgi:catalase